MAEAETSHKRAEATNESQDQPRQDVPAEGCAAAAEAAEYELREEPPAPPRVPDWMDGGLRIGIHTSISGDIANSLKIAHRLGCNTLQIFSASPRSWGSELGGRARRITPAEAARFRERRASLGLAPLVIHDNYLINLAATDPILRARSIQAFHEELIRAVTLGADFLVAHPGSGRGAAPERAIEAIAAGLRQATRGIRLDGLRILLENTAGQGTAVGSRFEELGAILQACRGLPLGVCLDTAHLYAAGHNIGSPEGLERTLEAVDRAIGLERVFVVHMNDSKAAFGSRVDRHQHIGKGRIGREAFRRILHHRALAGRAFILETPTDRPGDDRRNVRTLRELARVLPANARRRRKTSKRRPRRRGKASWRSTNRKRSS
jgi:deoxyribonuclease-4